MPDCYAKDCKNRATQCRKSMKQLNWEVSHVKISFHRIPKEPGEQKKWLDRMGLEPSSIPAIAALCSVHFDEKDLDRTSLTCSRLRPGAVPFVWISIRKSEYIFFNKSRLSYIYRNAGEKQIPSLKQGKVLNEHSLDQKACLIETYTTNLDTVKTASSSDQVSYKDSCTSSMEKYVSRGTTTSPCLLEDSAQNKIVQIALHNIKIAYRKKIRMIQQKQQRDMKRIAKFKDVIVDLWKKNLLDTKQLHILKDMELLLASRNRRKSGYFAGCVSSYKTTT